MAGVQAAKPKTSDGSLRREEGYDLRSVIANRPNVEMQDEAGVGSQGAACTGMPDALSSSSTVKS
jgi:hypothetical protein